MLVNVLFASFGCFGFRGELGFLNCDVCMSVVNKQLELLEFVSESVYVDLQYDEIYLTFTVVVVVRLSHFYSWAYVFVWC